MVVIASQDKVNPCHAVFFLSSDDTTFLAEITLMKCDSVRMYAFIPSIQKCVFEVVSKRDGFEEMRFFKKYISITLAHAWNEVLLHEVSKQIHSLWKLQ